MSSSGSERDNGYSIPNNIEVTNEALPLNKAIVTVPVKIEAGSGLGRYVESDNFPPGMRGRVIGIDDGVVGMTFFVSELLCFARVVMKDGYVPKDESNLLETNYKDGDIASSSTQFRIDNEDLQEIRGNAVSLSGAASLQRGKDRSEKIMKLDLKRLMELMKKYPDELETETPLPDDVNHWIEIRSSSVAADLLVNSGPVELPGWFVVENTSNPELSKIKLNLGGMFIFFSMHQDKKEFQAPAPLKPYEGGK